MRPELHARHGQCGDTLVSSRGEKYFVVPRCLNTKQNVASGEAE